MNDVCAACHFSYPVAQGDDLPARIVAEARRFTDSLAREPAHPELAWTAVEYAGHLADVLIIARERMLTTRLQPGWSTIAMGRDERVRWGEYGDLSVDQAGTDVVRAAERLAHTLTVLPTSDWSLTLVYNYPEPAVRTLRWLAAHALHEIVHHRSDLRRAALP